MTLQSTIEAIRARCTVDSQPAIMSSFGKDSMVLLALFRMLRINTPVIYHRQPWLPEKNRFADNVIAMWGLEVYDWPPFECGVKTHDDCIQPVAHYQYSEKAGVKIPIGILPPNGARYLCGRVEILGRPKASFLAPWKLLVFGQKASDVDIFEGGCELKTDFVQTDPELGAPNLFYPLKDWSDDDVWDFIEEHNVPYQKNRYNIATRKEFPSKHYNNDYVPACMRCIDRREPAMVLCPKTNEMIANVSAEVPDLEQKFDYITYR